MAAVDPDLSLLVHTAPPIELLSYSLVPSEGREQFTPNSIGCGSCEDKAGSDLYYRFSVSLLEAATQLTDYTPSANSTLPFLCRSSSHGEVPTQLHGLYSLTFNPGNPSAPTPTFHTNEGGFLVSTRPTHHVRPFSVLINGRGCLTIKRTYEARENDLYSFWRR